MRGQNNTRSPRSEYPSKKHIYGICATSHLRLHVGEGVKKYAMEKIERELEIDQKIDVLYDVPGNGPGALIFLGAVSEKAVAGFSSLGGREKRAEEVAREAIELSRNKKG